MMLAQISSLESQGIPQQSICNMASMVPKILGVEESAARELVKYFKGKGFSGELPARQCTSQCHSAITFLPWQHI